VGVIVFREFCWLKLKASSLDVDMSIVGLKS